MDKGKYLVVAFLGLFAGFLGAMAASYFIHPSLSSHDDTRPIKESTYDRVMRTQTIRCGYAAWAPLLIKDPNTGQMSGISHDYVEAMGAALKLKIDWAEEVGWGDFPAALESGRIDIFCAGAWPNSSRARQVDFVTPILYQPMYAYVRADDMRFDNHLVGINDPSVIISVMDGEAASAIAAQDFPQAKTLQIAQLSDGAENFVNVITKKADVSITDPATFAEYNAKNPGKLRRVIAKTPLRVFGDTLAIAHGQDTFRRMLNISTEEMLSSGQIEKITEKYEQFPGTLLRVAPTYQENGAL